MEIQDWLSYSADKSKEVHYCRIPSQLYSLVCVTQFTCKMISGFKVGFPFNDLTNEFYIVGPLSLTNQD